MDSDIVLTNEDTNYSQNTSLTNSLFKKGNDGLFWLRFYMLCMLASIAGLISLLCLRTLLGLDILELLQHLLFLRKYYN